MTKPSEPETLKLRPYEHTCSYEGCERPARRGNTICKIHYNAEWRKRQGPCRVDGCERQAGQRHLCPAHYARWRTGGDWQATIPQREKRNGSCSVDGCNRSVQARGYCSLHYNRLYLKGDAGPVGLRKAAKGFGTTDPKGYRYLTVDGRRIAEHRYVMEQMIGRPLYPFETPHHKNGRRADNRPENLELWVKPQLAGQRVEDLVAFVVEHYPTMVAAELRARCREQRTGQLRLG
jgi:HNH endonuclease